MGSGISTEPQTCYTLLIGYPRASLIGNVLHKPLENYRHLATFCGTGRIQKAVALLIGVVLSLQLLSYFLLGLGLTARLYPLITHLPNVLFIVCCLRKPLSIAIVSVLTAYLCCQPANWLGLALEYLWESTVAFHIGYTLGLLIMYVLLSKFATSSVNQVMSYSRRSLYLFGSFPLIYYVFDYTTTIHTGFLYSGAKIIVEFFPSVLSLFFIVFIIVYNNEMQRRTRLELDNIMLETRSEHAANEILSLQQVQHQTAIYRHDMRHHLALLYNLLESGESDKAMEYIGQTQKSIDGIVPTHYCENTTINLVISAFATKAEQSGVAMDVAAEVPEDLPFTAIDICTILANGLENAINAASETGAVTGRESETPSVRIKCQVHKNNLLILIENTFTGQAEIINGLPYTNKEGHGFGVKSIKMLVNRHKGYYSFSAKEGLFTLKIVLPMG